MSQSELARAVGLQQATISDLVNGKSRSSTRLVEIARALRTTAEYLSGQHDDPAAAAEFVGPSGSNGPHGGQSAFTFTRDEELLVEHVRALDPTDRKAVLTLIDSLWRCAPASSATLHNDRRAYHAEPPREDRLRPRG